jgi:hypothetical protein
MNTFSQPVGCLTTSPSDTITVTQLTPNDICITSLSSDTITLPTTIDWSNSPGTITFNTAASTSGFTVGGSGASMCYTTNNCVNSYSTISIGSIFGNNIEWQDGFPDWDRIQKMCKEYPGLQIAFDKFKTVYKLVKDDYDNPDTKK